MRYLLGAALAAMLFIHAGRASAADTRWSMELKLDRAFTGVADAAAKRKVGVLTISGRADVAGKKADVAIYGLIDYTNGSGRWQDYMTMTFADGSVLTVYGNGVTQADAQGLNTRFQGPLTVIGGTGRYQGAHGGGSVLGMRARSVGDDVMIHYDVMLDFKM